MDKYWKAARLSSPGSVRPGALGLLGAALLALAACQTVPPTPPDPYLSGETAGTAVPASAQVGDSIVICGERVPIGAPVVLWTDEGGYDAHDTRIRPGSSPEYADRATGRRFTPGRRERGGERRQLVPVGTHEGSELARFVDQFVVHYDVCGVSRTCFRVLQHDRGLSVHFLLDIDGTIYQTLDVRETAWHATKANPRSIGVEIAQIGAWPPAQAETMEIWYARDEEGAYIDVPDRLGDGGVRTPGFVGRPARPGRIAGTINGVRLVQYDFTPEQYDSLARLIAALARKLPRIRLDAPRDFDGGIRDRVLGDAEYEAFSGILAHWHVQQNKTDPGPAFDWEKLLRLAYEYY